MNLFEFETSLFKEEYLNNREYLESIFHNDYMEYGKSGLIYYKNDTIESLYGLGNRDIEILNFTSKKLDEKTFIAHYVSVHNGDVKVLRTSIWKENDGYLQLFFHQGTLMSK